MVGGWVIKLSLVCGIHKCAVGVGNADGLGGWPLVYDGGGDGAEVSCTTTVCYSDSVRWYYAWWCGGTYGINSTR
jgi:hypothetical protein